MSDVINYLTTHPLALGIAVIFSLLIVLSFARRILRFLVVLVALGILYIAWVSWHGGNPAEKAENASKSVKEAVHQGGNAMKVFDRLFKQDERSREGE